MDLCHLRECASIGDWAPITLKKVHLHKSSAKVSSFVMNTHAYNEFLEHFLLCVPFTWCFENYKLNVHKDKIPRNFWVQIFLLNMHVHGKNLQ